MSYVQRRRFLWILFLAGLAAIVLVANATTLSRLQFEELVQRATAIGRFRCISAQSRWENGEIWTETRFLVVEQSKGHAAGVVTVKQIGGRVGGLHSIVDGAPAFQPGEEVYLFLWSQSQGGEPYQLLGWGLGTFRITRDATTGFERVTQDSAAQPVFDTRAKHFRRGTIRNLPITVFQLKLRKALEN